MPAKLAAEYCLEHVQSIQPTVEELKALQEFDTNLLFKTESWPPHVTNCVSRWMHRHNLYKVSLSKANSLSELAAALVSYGNMPIDDAVRKRLENSCASLVTKTALNWEETGLLVQRGQYLSKCHELKKIWPKYEGAFIEAERSQLQCDAESSRCSSGDPLLAPNFKPQQSLEAGGSEDCIVVDTASASRAGSPISPSSDQHDVDANVHVAVGQVTSTELTRSGEALQTEAEDARLPPSSASQPIRAFEGQFPEPAAKRTKKSQAPDARLVLATQNYPLHQVLGGRASPRLDPARDSATLNRSYQYSIVADVDKRFAAISQVHMPNTIRGNLAIADIAHFTERNVTEFFGYFSEVFGAVGRVFSGLSFGLPDVASPTPVYPFTRIADGDYASFERLKTSVLDHFRASFNRNPTITIFRLIVNAPSQEVDSLSLASRGPSPVYQLPPITVRIQMNRQGLISDRLPSRILHPKQTNKELFKWFAQQTRCGEPLGPSELKFAFKDMVSPRINTIQRGKDDHFEYMLNDIFPQCKKAAANIPGLSEFEILITVPNWPV